MSGIKTEKNKKFNPININNFYQGVSNQSNKTNVVRHVGLQPLGKVGINRRQPAQQSLQNANDTNSIAIDNSSATSSPTSSSFSSHQHHLSQQNKPEETLQKRSSSQDLHNSHKQQPVSQLHNQHQLQPQASQGSQVHKSQSKTNQIEHLSISDTIVDKEAKQKLNQEDRLVIQPLKQAELATERQLEPLAHLSPGSNSSRQQQSRGNIRHQHHDDPRVRIDNDQLNNKRANTHNSPSSGGSLSFNNKPTNMVTKNSNKPRLAATQVPIVTDKELENLDNITRQTKWASGRITIDYDAKLNFSDDEDEQQQQKQELELEKKQPQMQPKQQDPPETVSNGNDIEKNSTDESMNNHREHHQDPPVRFNIPRHNQDVRVRDHHSEDILHRRNNIGSKSNNYSNNSSYKSGHSNIIPNNINNSSNSNTNNSSSNYNNHTHHHHHEPVIRHNSRHNHNETRQQNANEPRYNNNSSTINNITSQSATNTMNNNNICKSSSNVSNSTDNSSHSITNINQPHLGQHQQPFFTGHRGTFERPRFLRETHHQQPPHHLHHNSPPHRQHHHRNDSPPLSSSNQHRHPRLQKQHQQHQNQNRELEQASNNKFRPVVSRVFYRSDIKRISGGKTGDNFLSKS